jgi:hypothetical protein
MTYYLNRRKAFRGGTTWTAENATLNPYDSNLKAVWRFDNGALLVDSVGANTFTNNNAVTNVAGGIYGYGADFEQSSSQYLSLASIPADLKPTAQMTYNMWFKPESQPSSGKYQQLIYSGITSPNVQMYYKNNSGTPEMQAYLYTDGGTESQVVTQTLTNATQYMLTLRADGTNFRLFVNGSAIGANNAYDGSIVASPTGEYRIGTDNGGGNMEYLDGIVDELYFWNTGLSDAAITALYNTATGSFYTG